jgi:hypothetical protein
MYRQYYEQDNESSLIILSADFFATPFCVVLTATTRVRCMNWRGSMTRLAIVGCSGTEARTV